MPARLKSFELHGYKTFASRTEFIFADGITAIVGPNGSGKSNVADALRWVLGEQSFGLLRAKKTEDMIFAGSEYRPRAGMASATIVFDNSDGWLPIDFGEVGITRRAYRDGENEYLLNGQRVRLRDVSELLARSGLAERTYTVIGQGLVDAALSLKAEERRRLFEEAAGIGLHRSRRDEALRRLDTTRRNLERVQDILTELQPRVRSLERQAKRAQEFEQVRADLKILLREWYGYHWNLAQSDLTEASEALRYQESLLDKARADQVNLDNQVEQLRSNNADLRNRIREWNLRLSNAYSQKEKLSRNLGSIEEMLRSHEIQAGIIETDVIRLGEELNYYAEQSDQAKADVERLEQEKSEIQIFQNKALRELEDQRMKRDAAENEIAKARHSLSELLTQKSVLEAQIAELHASNERREGNISKIEVTLDQNEQDLANLQKSIKSETEKIIENDLRLRKYEKDIQKNRDDISELEGLRSQTTNNLNSSQASYVKLQTQLDIFKQAENDLSGYADGARLLIKAARESKISGARDVLSDHINVPDEYEIAISSVLGEYLEALLVNNWTGIDEGLDILDKGSSRGALFMLESLSSHNHAVLDLRKVPEINSQVIGVASELVKVEANLQPVINFLLGQVVIVKDRQIARRILADNIRSTMPQLRIVTLKGEVFSPQGAVLSSSSGNRMVNRPKYRLNLEQSITKINQEIDKFTAELTDINKRIFSATDQGTELSSAYESELIIKSQSEKEINRLELAVEKAHRSRMWYQEQSSNLTQEIQDAKSKEDEIRNSLQSLEVDIREHQETVHEKIALFGTFVLDEYQDKAAYWLTQSAVIQHALTEAKDKQAARLNILASSLKEKEDQERRRIEITSEMKDLVEKKASLLTQQIQLNEEIEELRASVSSSESELFDVEKSLNQTLSADMAGRQHLSVAEHQHAQARINFSKRQEIVDTLRRRIEDDFGLVAFEYVEAASGPKPLPIDGMVEALPVVVMITPDLEENVQRQRSLLRRMGPVNPEAQSEYIQVKERYEFLSTQSADLRKAEDDIQGVIAELDLLMEHEFRKTFEAVAHEFRQIFTRLFGGGMARLILTDPDDISGTGIDIEAKLPGRREQGLSLLSGGERSLTASALVFALLRISPTPFCILDEVDAMLDEANVGRFRELLQELSENTQFIIITHNRNTVQAASVIYGVTMGRDTSSQVISLQLDEFTNVITSER